MFNYNILPMKKIILFVLLHSPIFLQAQLNYDKWEVIETVDEFGDKTGEKVAQIFAKGTFSNSATTNSELIVRISDYEDMMFISLFEYGKTPEAKLTYDSSFGKISIKREDGLIEKYQVMASKDGGIYLGKKNKLATLIRDGNEELLKVYISDKQFSDYGSSTYNFKIKTQKRNE